MCANNEERDHWGCERGAQVLLSEGSFANTFWYNPNPTPESSEGTGDEIFCGDRVACEGVVVALAVFVCDVFLLLPALEPLVVFAFALARGGDFVLESHADLVMVAFA